MRGTRAVRAAWAVAVAALVLVSLPGVAFGQAAPLRIVDATPDLAAGTITIAGSGFGTRPFVTLDLVPLNVQLALDQRVIAAAPLGMMPAGRYLLTVTRGERPGDTASVDLQVGSVSAAATPSPSTGSAAASSRAADAPPASAAPLVSPMPAPGDVAARVGDRTITLAELDREWQRTDPSGYLAASRELYDARRRLLTDMVNSELLAREAASRRVTVDALLAEELPKRSVPLPDNALTTLYQSMGDRTRGASLEQLRPALREWLARKVEPDLARMTYLEELTKVSTNADILLLSPRVEVEHRADDPTLGPASAPVELVLFGDFQSPAYARQAATLGRVRDMFGTRIRIVFKPFPVNDPASLAAAEAAACANAQGKFWPFHDTLLGAAGALDDARFQKVASEAGLDRPGFARCVEGHEMRDRVTSALDEARRYDIPAPGSILVNGRLAPEAPAFLPTFEYFKRLVEEELARQAREGRR
ncbi:MAG: thioredoxin domain-containing protein [Acidobacteria bacterium]|nr:thioredoxin domain-containing protein [Acidobacteriota bacterium]